MAECPETKEGIEYLDQPSTSSSASTSRESSSKVSTALSSSSLARLTTGNFKT